MSAIVAAITAAPVTTSAQAPEPPLAAIVEGGLFQAESGSTTRRVARQWHGQFVETRYVDEPGRRMAYLVRWQVKPDERDRIPWHDLDKAIRVIFDDVEPTEGRAWRNGAAEFRLFGLSQGQLGLACAGFRRDEGDSEGTFGLLCRPASQPMATDEAERFAGAVRTGPDPTGADDEPPT
jgi:hypothetical protein